MFRSILAAAFLCLASVAHAKCVNIPLCFAPFVPPAEALILYENGVAKSEWGAKCLPGIPQCTGFPFWAPAGGLQTTAWYCTGNETAKLSFAVVQNGVGTPGQSRTCVATDRLGNPQTNPCTIGANSNVP